MVDAKNIQFTFPVPDDVDPEDVGNDVIEFIIERSKAGLDINGRPFPAYTKEYAEWKGSSDVDLTLDDIMLNNISILSMDGNSVTVGYAVDDPQAGKAEGNAIGSYGRPFSDPLKARNFIGIDEDNLMLIIEKHRLGNLSKEIERVNEELENYLSGYKINEKTSSRKIKNIEKDIIDNILKQYGL